ncbi:hypothetical protein DLM77_06040 [Leptospira yasudae]|uniref:Lipoprotein n=1 Tax=Leptospira yasudae TaxID=2202201 RepID=A0ABX9M6T5_9LEPT|nr:hypothetical protein DLM77_06040 [Leptospira yasudae]
MIGSEKALRSSFYILCIFMALNCFVGSRKDACKYNLQEGNLASNCDYVAFGLYANSQNTDSNTLQERLKTLNYLLLECFKYHERLRECEKEEYKYMPAIYGINSNPTSDANAERIVREK